MKTILHHVFMYDEKWKEVVVEDFRFICTSGLFKECDKLYIFFTEEKTSGLLTGEEWIRYFWGRIDGGKKVYIHSANEETDMEKWEKEHPGEEMIYINSNNKL